MVVLDKQTHTYTRRDNGLVVPGVTSILDATFQVFAKVPPDVLEYARELGTIVHETTELYDRNDLDAQSVDPVVEPYLEAWIKFRREQQPQILAIEQTVFHPLYGYAGMFDRGARLFDEKALLDIKTSSALDLALVGPQLAAYLEAINDELRRSPLGPKEERYTRRYGIQLREDGTYRLVECKDPADLAVFLSCLNIQRWRQKHGLTSR
jgi:hypothetical protein